MNTDELKTDDEILRMDAMTDGPKQVSRFKLRPVTPLTMSWMLRNGFFEDEFGDMLLKTSTFAYLHSADKAEVRSVVNNRERFLNAVDEWMDANIAHHSELDPVSREMTEAIDRYMSSVTSSANQAPDAPVAKN